MDSDLKWTSILNATVRDFAGFDVVVGDTLIHLYEEMYYKYNHIHFIYKKSMLLKKKARNKTLLAMMLLAGPGEPHWLPHELWDIISEMTTYQDPCYAALSKNAIVKEHMDAYFLQNAA